MLGCGDSFGDDDDKRKLFRRL